MKPPAARLFAAIYTDEDVPHLLAVLLRERGFEAASVAEWETWGLGDEEQLALATERGHALLSFNRDDFIALARDWYQTGKEHAGIVLAPQHPLDAMGRMVRQVSDLLDSELEKESPIPPLGTRPWAACLGARRRRVSRIRESKGV